MIAIPAIALPFVIRAAVVKGVATATEVRPSASSTPFSLAPDLPAVFMAAPVPDADRYCGAIGCDSAHHRCGDRNGLGSDPVGLLGFAGKVHDRAAGGVPIFLAVTIVAFVVLGSVLEGIPAIVLFGPAALPDRASGRGSRRPLCNGRHSRDGHWPFRASVSGWVTTRHAPSAASTPMKA